VRTVIRWSTGEAVTTVDFDAVEAEAPSHEVAITEYPIELGASLIDYVRPRPVTLRLTGIVSNSPSRTGLSHMDGFQPVANYAVRARVPVIDVPPSANLPTSVAGVPLSREITILTQVRTWSTNPDGNGRTDARIQRVENVYAALKQAMNEAREMTVVTDLLGEFDRMLMRSLRTQRDARSGNSLRLEMELQQVAYADLLRRDVSALIPKKPVEPRSEPPQEEGKKEPGDADAATEADETLAHRIFG
jgi:hypothetical protein